MKTVKEKLYHFEATPPPDAWDNISGKINNGKVIQLKNRKRTRTTALFTAAAAIIIVLLINFVFIRKTTGNEHEQAISIAHQDDDSIERNNELLESIIRAPENRKLIASRNAVNKGFLRYITIEGPEGQPVKISPKVATLIVSADNDYPPKPIWDVKVGEWQNIMLTTNITPTSVSLLEIVQLVSKN